MVLMRIWWWELTGFEVEEEDVGFIGRRGVKVVAVGSRRRMEDDVADVERRPHVESEFQTLLCIKTNSN